MQIIQVNSAKKSLLIFAIILCIYPLYTTAAEIRTFSHEEKKNDYGSTAIPHVRDTKIYDDNTIVARIVRVNENTSTENTTCFYEMFSLRIIHPDGTVDENDIELDIPQFNYCIPSMLGPIGIKNGKPILFLDFIDYHLIRKNHILITYYNKATPYEEWGMVIGLDGNVLLDRTPFGFVYSDNISELMPNSNIKLNINREKGFLRLADSVDTSKPLEWQQYRIEPKGNFTKLTTGILEIFGLSSLTSTILSTVDENYAIVYTDPHSSTAEKANLSFSQELFFLPIGYNQQSISPLLLYQSPFPITGLSCDIAFIEVGHVCILTIQFKFYAKINFLSSGSVTNFTAFNNFGEIKIAGNGEIDSGFLDNAWFVNNLPFGGYLITRYYFTANSSSFRIFDPIYIYGYLFGDDDTNYTNWEFDEPIKETHGVFQILRDYTLLVAQIETNNSWQFRVTDLPKFTGNKDKGYFNPNVKATFPEIDESSINPNISEISIDFYNPVELSSGNLSIYQMVGRKQYLRQSIPGELCLTRNDSKTVIANVLESTFSVSKGNYFIEVDNDFVRDKALNEPSSGIRENIWLFTAEEKKDTFTPSATGLLRLTPEGTQKFDNFSRNERHDFFDTLLKELSENIPVSLSRLTTVGKAQLNNSLSERQYLISVHIVETRDEHDNSVESIFRIINAMVRNKNQTPIGSGDVTRYLDESYGFIRLPDLWKTYKINLIGLSLIVLLLIGLFILAERRTKEKDKEKPVAAAVVAAIFSALTLAVAAVALAFAVATVALIVATLAVVILTVAIILAKVKKDKKANEQGNKGKREESKDEQGNKEKREGSNDEQGNKYYNNKIILLQFAIIFDLVMDLLFVGINAGDISILYIPSILFLTLPIIINTILTSNVIIQENTDPKFYRWLFDNVEVASILAVLACADIAILNILKSNLAGLQSFNAPFSDSAKSKIIWGSLLNIFIEDIPQFIIQVYYQRNAVFYGIIPLLTLISSSVNLAIYIVDIMYETTYRVTIPRYDDKIPE